MNVAFIGAGKVGRAMGLFLKAKGVNVLGYYSRSVTSAEKAALIIEGDAFNSLYDLTTKADIIAITTTDDAIEQVLKKLLELKIDWTDKYILHMSGALSSELLLPLHEKRGIVLSLHPMLAFNVDPFKAAKDLQETYFTIEGKGEIEKLITYFRGLGIQLTEISTANKVLYHTSATIVSNYIVALMDIGIKMLVDVGFSKETAQKLLAPLINNNIKNVLEVGAETALTGPIARGDIGTVQKHLDYLTDYNQQIADIYRSLGRQTIDLAKRAGKINDLQILELKEVLQDGKAHNHSHH